MVPGPVRDQFLFTVGGIRELLREGTAGAPALVENDGRGGRPLCWGQRALARARGRLGRTAGFPGRGRGELAAEKRREGKGTCPKK